MDLNEKLATYINDLLLITRIYKEKSVPINIRLHNGAVKSIQDGLRMGCSIESMFEFIDRMLILTSLHTVDGAFSDAGHESSLTCQRFRKNHHNLAVEGLRILRRIVQKEIIAKNLEGFLTEERKAETAKMTIEANAAKASNLKDMGARTANMSVKPKHKVTGITARPPKKR